MSQDANSLDRLNDIVLPPEISWWPLAPGWYLLFVLLLLVAGWLSFRWYKNWQANAYRRTALRALQNMNEPAEIAELLRRTALAFTPREEVARLKGESWVQWLSAHGSVEIPMGVRNQLQQGIYQAAKQNGPTEPLRTYAADWITHHVRPVLDD